MLRDSASGDLVAAAAAARHREAALQKQKEEAVAAGAAARETVSNLQVRRSIDACNAVQQGVIPASGVFLTSTLMDA